MHAQDLRQLRILIVNDKDFMRSLVGDLLRGLGIRNQIKVADALEALQKLREETVDVMIADLDMCPVDGLMLTRLIRTSEDSPNPDLRIVLLTAETDPATVTAGREAGVDAYLAKPLSARALQEHLIKATVKRHDKPKTNGRAT